MQEYSYAQALNQGICEEMRRNEKVMVLGEDVGKYGGVFGVTRGLYDEFGGDRVRDCPLNEAAIVSFGIDWQSQGVPLFANWNSWTS